MVIKKGEDYGSLRKWKWRTKKDFGVQTDIRPERDIVTEYVILTVDGHLIVKKRYCWDGATGFPDIPSVMRGSLFHDALYGLGRAGLLDWKWRSEMDKLIKDCCLEDGMWHWLAKSVHRTVRRVGGVVGK